MKWWPMVFSWFLVLAPAKAELYDERWRPQFHFSPPRNWMNDPNGMVYYDGEYHLFYQFNPFGDKWGHMSWGHAISPDLITWENLPVALQEEDGVMIFSGSAVVDWENSSGFGIDGKPPLVAIYTGHYTERPLQNQHIAFSNDRGRTWTKFSGNPVLDIGERDFRDPKVIWHSESKRWVMTIAWPHRHMVRFYTSPNLKNWTHASDFGPAGATGGIWECPDLFPMRAADESAEKWVLIVNLNPGGPAGGSACQYFIGDFDGSEFRLDSTYPRPQPEFVPTGRLLADFEGNDYRGWQTRGTAFGDRPARGTLPSQQAVSGFRGSGLVNSYLNGDRAEGTLTSPEFDIDRAYLSFLIGGGNHKDATCLTLLVDGGVVRSATGDNNEKLIWKSWDVRDLAGRKGRLEVVDRHQGGWGHINLDEVLLADQPARNYTEQALWADYAPDFYAAVSWSDIPESDGRRLWLGWMSDWRYASDVPTSPWRSAMSIPRELRLKRTSEGLRLVQTPVRELEKLRVSKEQSRDANIGELNRWLTQRGVGGAGWEYRLTAGESPFELALFGKTNGGITLRYAPGSRRLVLDRTESENNKFHPAFSGVYEAPLSAGAGEVDFHIYVDRSSVEVFADGGLATLTALSLPTDVAQPAEFRSSDPGFRLKRIDAWKLKSAVPRAKANPALR